MARYTQQAVTIYGNEAINTISDDVKQLYNDTCAVKSQQLVLESFGINISEDQLRNEAYQHGWYSPGGGTNMYDVGKLLELHDIETNRYENCNIFNLTNELAQGHKVIVGVDSGELWHSGFWEKMEDRVIGKQADHALLVSGIDTSDPNNVKVIVTDPGTGDYCREYSMEQFVDAWQDSHCYMVSTAEAMPDIFEPFGNDITHLPMIGDMPYDYFVNNYAFLQDIENRSVFEEFTQMMFGNHYSEQHENNESDFETDSGLELSSIDEDSDIFSGGDSGFSEDGIEEDNDEFDTCDINDDDIF